MTLVKWKSHLPTSFIIVGLFVMGSTRASTNNSSEAFSFKHLTIENGLSSNIVTKIIEDSYGFIWIATQNGLNRFDGSSIVTFYYEPSDSGSIPNNDISSLAVDHTGNLWIGTKSGLCRFNYETEKFEKHLQYGPGERNYITSLYVDKKDIVWVGTEHGLFIFNRNENTFQRMLSEGELNLFAPLSFTEDKNGTVFVGTWEKGFYQIPETHNYFKREIVQFNDVNNETGINTLEAILVDRNNTLLLGSLEGLVKASKNSSPGKNKYSYSWLFKNEKENHVLSDNYIHALCEDNSGRLWIGTEYGLNIYDPNTQKITQQLNDPKDPQSLSNNLVRCIFRDSNGNIWVGTYQGGVNMYYPNQERFQNYFPAINNTNNQRMRYVKSILEDNNNNLWIGTDLGLLQFSDKGQLLRSLVYKPGDKSSLNVGGVSALYQDRKGRIWVGTWGGGLHELNPVNGRFFRLPWLDEVHNNPGSQGDVNVRSITEDSKGNLWIGHIRGYLDKYSPESKIFEHYRFFIKNLTINAAIIVVKVDNADNVWIGTQGGGLIKLYPKTKKMVYYGINSNEKINGELSINSKDIYALHFSGKDTLWIGTGNGLNMFDLLNKKTKFYTTANGLPSNLVYSILQDDAGNLWLSTLKGISKFDIKTEVFINYDNRDGVRINSEAGFKSSTGWLFFGGVNGINALNPMSMNENRVIPPIALTDLKIFNKSVPIGKKSILKKHINLTDDIILDYNQNVLSIEFVALNYINPDKNQYACKLEKFDKEWVLLGSHHEARYTNLNPGDYVLHMKASNNDGLWNEKGRMLKIKILPPWWKSLLFRIILVISLFSLILFWILARTYRLKQQHLKLQKLVIERTEEIEKQKIKLQEQAQDLTTTNHLLVEKQNEVQAQKEAIARQNEKLEVKNKLLEDQNIKIIEQRNKEQEMANKLHEADQMKLRFFTNISHEFRTPLTLILGPLEKLLSEFSANTGFSDQVLVIQRNTFRLLNLINQFLDLSKLDAGVVKLIISKGDLFNYVNGIVNAYQFVARQKNIDYKFISPVEEYFCYFDADKIEKILYNLLSNAFKFTPAGGKITVSVELFNKETGISENPDTLKIIVSDTGKGIPPELLSRIFERFYQVDLNSNNKNPGTGIGLALTEDLVQIYRGQIKVESKPGAGSSFIVTLPIDLASFRETELSSDIPDVDQLKHQAIVLEDRYYEALTAEDNLPESKKAAILVVDDNKDIRKYLKDNLGDIYQIIEASDGAVGLEKAIKYLPALVICDVMMPVMDGYELCAKLKTDIRTCHIPVIILTAKATAEDQLESIETGADVYISKPFDIQLLGTHANQLIITREQLKMLYRRELTLRPSDIIVESTDEKLINRIIKVMSDNISNSDFGVEDLGREVGMSRTHLYRKLKQLTNLTAIEFVRNMRLQRAAQLFRQNKKYVAEVAYMSGFKELSYFRKIFKEFYGISPQEYTSKENQHNS
jgi:signal transduction histidine kinase/ligand-binding sensor domain-containing protein/CheY-like chemotaxis protein